LLVAYQDKRVIGYLGILPDKIFGNCAASKIGWLTSWWIDPHCATTGVGAVLLFKALNAYRQNIGVSGGSRNARKVLHASRKFPVSTNLRGLDIRLRFNVTKTVLRKVPAMKIFRVFLRIFDVAMDEIVNLRKSLWEQRDNLGRNLTFEYISSIDEETDRFIQRHHQNDLTRKGKAELSWIMSYPWILSAPSKDSAAGRYYFSSLCTRFSYLGVKVFERNHALVGFFILKVRDNRTSVVYSYFEDRHAPSIAAAVVHHTLAMDAAVLSLYDERLVAGLSEIRFPFWSSKTASRGFYMTKMFADIPLSEYRLHGGDGDLAFY
jgi:hypothetical protein